MKFHSEKYLSDVNGNDLGKISDIDSEIATPNCINDGNEFIPAETNEAVQENQLTPSAENKPHVDKGIPKVVSLVVGDNEQSSLDARYLSGKEIVEFIPGETNEASQENQSTPYAENRPNVEGCIPKVVNVMDGDNEQSPLDARYLSEITVVPEEILTPIKEKKYFGAYERPVPRDATSQPNNQNSDFVVIDLDESDILSDQPACYPKVALFSALLYMTVAGIIGLIILLEKHFNGKGIK